MLAHGPRRRQAAFLGQGDHALSSLPQRLARAFGGGHADPPGSSCGGQATEQGFARWSAGSPSRGTRTGVAWFRGGEKERGGWRGAGPFRPGVRLWAGKCRCAEGFDHFVADLGAKFLISKEILMLKPINRRPNDLGALEGSLGREPKGSAPPGELAFGGGSGSRPGSSPW